jgi:hypothetical protein
VSVADQTAFYIQNLAQRLKTENVDRDTRMRAVQLVRTGHANMLYKGIFPSDWPQPIVANTIDVVAQDLSESVGTLPTFTAAGDSILDESKRSRADKLTKIINYYVYHSRMGTRLVQGADRLMTYGFLPIRVEADYENQAPYVQLDDPMGSYFHRDRFGNLVSYLRVFKRKASDLAAMFPEHAAKFEKKSLDQWGNKNNPLIELVRYWDKDSERLVMIDNKYPTVLSQVENKMGRLPVVIAGRPSLDDSPRGSFDDVLWVFAAKAKLALLSLEATQKAVEAPIALPTDVQEMAFGPDAILRSNNPERIRRVPMELPQSSMITESKLDDELKFGSRFPEARAGQLDSSVVTGRGVQALMGGFDSRIKVAQSNLGDALAEALSMCLEMDEKIWPNTKKEVHSVTNGTPYKVTYTPGKDIKGERAVTSEYGVMAGLDPNRALVWGLQGLGAGIFSKSYLRRNLPVNMDVAEEEKVIDVEKLRDAALAAVSGYAQAIPEMAAGGADPQQAIAAIQSLIADRKKGVPIEAALETAFAPPEPTQPGAAPGQAPGEAPQPGGLGGASNAPPSMQQMLASLAGNGEVGTSVRTLRQQSIA